MHFGDSYPLTSSTASTSVHEALRSFWATAIFKLLLRIFIFDCNILVISSLQNVFNKKSVLTFKIFPSWPRSSVWLYTCEFPTEQWLAIFWGAEMCNYLIDKLWLACCIVLFSGQSESESLFSMVVNIFINKLVHNQLYILNGKVINKTITSSHCCLSSWNPPYNCLSRTSQLFLICVYICIFHTVFPGSLFHLICLSEIFKIILTVNINAVLSIRCSV